jgi:hypothetical protein
MASGALRREIDDILNESAGSSFLGQAAIVNKGFPGDFGNDKLLRLTVKLFEGIRQSLDRLAVEIEDLGSRVADLEGSS